MPALIPAKQLSDSPVNVAELYQPSQRGATPLKEGKIYSRRIKGFYQRLRRYIATPLLAAFFLLPWLHIDNRPAIFLDLSSQKFHVFWMTFWPQDGMLLTGILIIAALGLFAVTARIGRVWCGFSCPQTVWTQMFIWLEDKCEGDRQKRIKLDAKPWDIDKLLRKSSKHFLWVALSLVSGLTFISYFYNARELVADIVNLTIGLDALFWIGLFSSLTYINAGWMREQFCKFACPYSRFQSVMYDQNTKTIAYDAKRGDSFVDKVSGEAINKLHINQDLSHLEIEIKRLPRNSKLDHRENGLGDCINCEWCVQVCPVGIDIRDGLQDDCISCGLCIDACDNIMDHMEYERGLIRFASENELAGKDNTKNKSYFVSLRSAAYALVVVIICGLFTNQLLNRTPLNVSIVRDRGVNLYRERNDHIENVYNLRIGNMSRKTHNFDVSVFPPYELKGRRQITLAEGEIFSFPLRVSLHKSKISAVQQSLVLNIRSLTDESVTVTKDTTFISPKSD